MQEAVAAPSANARSRWIKVSLLLVPALAFLALMTLAVLNRDPAPQVGDPAPAFEAELLGGGGTLALDDLKGKPVVVNFWASWCVPCKEEAPLLREAQERYGDEIAFVGIDIRDARDDAMDFAPNYGPGFLHVRDEDLTIYDSFGLTGQPETFFIDENGVILEHIPGPVYRETLFPLLDSLRSRSA